MPVNDLRDELCACARHDRSGLNRHSRHDSRMIATIGGIALAATFARDRFMSLLAKTEGGKVAPGSCLRSEALFWSLRSVHGP